MINLKRKTKNILSILLLVLILTSIIFTMFYAKNKYSTMDMENSAMQDTGMQEMPSMPSSENNSNSKLLSASYYVIFGIESLILSLVLCFIIMSSFNKKSVRETFMNKDKIAIYILFCLVLSIFITFVLGIITNNYFFGNSSNNIPNNGGSSNNTVSYSGSKEITTDTKIDSGEYSSTTKDENAILVSGNIDVTLSNITVQKSGDTSGGDNSNFYGNNSAIIAKSGSKLTIKNVIVNTTGSGANGVFSYGGSVTTSNSSSDGTTINISDSTITTVADNAGGIMTTGGGITNATNLNVNTSGTSSAAIRSDRGGGTVTVNKGTYTTTGQGSPAIYSTATITASDATLTSKSSEGVVIEGKNSVILNSCTLTDSNTKLNGNSTTYKNVFLYQSMSGDADTGSATFESSYSTIITNKGDSFYVTNTTASITLKNNEIINNDSDGNFLRIQKDSWGKEGSNGGNVTLSLITQSVNGNIVVDSISTLDMNMKTNSYFEGTINNSNEAKSINLTLDKTSSIKLTSDSYVSSLSDTQSDYSNINFNGHKLYVNEKSIN